MALFNHLSRWLQRSLRATVGLLLCISTLVLTTVDAFAAAPTIASSVTALQPTGATLNGTFTLTSTSASSVYRAGTAKFCYSTSASLSSCSGGTVTTISLTDSSFSPTYSTGSPDTTSHAIASVVTGLTAGTTYYYQFSVGYGTSSVGYSTTSSFRPGYSATNTATGGTAITNVSATIGGTVNPNGDPNGTAVTICWSASASMANCTGALGTVSVEGALTGSSVVPVSAAATGLTPSTTYYYLVQAVSGAPSSITTYSSVGSFTTAGPTFTTLSASSVTNSTATLNGTVNAGGAYATSVVQFCYSTTSSIASCSGATTAAGSAPSFSDAVDHAETAAITGLKPLTTYYAIMSATQSGVTVYSTSFSFTTGGPTLATSAATSVANGTVTLNGTINANGYATTSIQFCYSTSNSFSSSCSGGSRVAINASKTSIAAGDSTLYSLTANVTGLNLNATYYYVLVATQAGSTILSTSPTSFTTTGPTLATTSASNLTGTSATMNGTINPNGYSTTLRFCYSTSSSISSCSGATAITVSGGPFTGSSVQSVSADISGLLSGTTYYYILEANQSGSIGLASSTSFKTLGPTLTSTNSSTTNILQTSVTLNGTVNANGTSTGMSFCYSLSTMTNCSGSGVLFATATPATATGNSGTAELANLTGLSVNSTYYYQLIGTQGANTYYSPVYTFATPTPGPIMNVTTVTATGIQSSSATLTGSVNPGNYATTSTFCLVTTRPSSGSASCAGGISVRVSGTTTGTTTQTITATATGLTASTRYYMYLIGTNSQGTNYSTVGSSTPQFTTLALSPVSTTLAATNVTSSTALLKGTVQPNGQSTTISFCYSTSASMVDCTGASVAVLANTYSGTSVQNISLSVSGLTGNTQYCYLIRAAGSLTTYSSPLCFTTLSTPTITVTGTTNMADVTAIARGTVSANGSATTIQICYSTASLSNCQGSGTVKYMTVPGSPFSSSASSTAFTATMRGLVAQTKYYYQVVATNAVGSSYSGLQSFTTIGAPFGVITNFYQVSATSPMLYYYASLSGTQNTLGSNTITGINALGFNTVDGYIYGIDANSVLYKIDNTGGYYSMGTVQGLPARSNTGGDFIPGTNMFVVNNGTTAWYEIDVSAATPTAVTFTLATAQGSNPWSAADIAFQQIGSTFYGYGMNGAQLNTISFTGSSSTTAAETSRVVVSGTAGVLLPTGTYGASFSDGNGNAFFFSNTASQMWEISATQLANGQSTVTATLVATAAPALVGPNDGAANPYVQNPFDPPLPLDDSYNVLQGGTLTVNSTTSSLLANDQSGLSIGVNSVTFMGTTVTTAGTPITINGVGTLTVTDFTNGYFTFVPVAGYSGAVSFTYTVIETSSPTTVRTSTDSATVSIYVQLPQTVTWSPTTSITTTQSPYSPSPASGQGAISYSTTSPNTSGCSVDPSTGVLTYIAAGSCTVTATAAGNATYASASTTVTFTISLAAQTITWSPTLSLTSAQSPYSAPSGAFASGNGTISYSVQSGFTTTTCSVNASTGVLTYTGTGTCTVIVSAAATATYDAATSNYVFSVASGTQTVTWSPSTALTATAGSNTFTAATTTGVGSTITYTVLDPGTTGCAIATATSPTVTFTGAGSCQVQATASATASAAAASVIQTFVISVATQTVTWSPTTSYTMTSTSASPSAATDLGSVPITYAVTNAGTTGCTVNATTGALSWTGAGSCTVAASAAATSLYGAASTSVTFTIALAAQTVTWAPTTSYTVLQSPQSLTAATTNGTGAISYAVTTAGAGCTVDASTGALTFTSTGTCTVTATAAANSVYAAATRAVTFTISLATQAVTWSPTTTLTYPQGVSGITLQGATTTGDGAITYTYSSKTSGTSSCAVTAGVMTFATTTSASGTCTITATAAATSIYASASTQVTFSIVMGTQVVSWNPSTSLATSQSPYTPASATTSGTGAISYAIGTRTGLVSSCSVVSGTGVLTYAATGAGTCSVTATAAAVSNRYSAASTTVTFNITTTTLPSQTISWISSPQSISPNNSPQTFTAATTSGDGAISYAVQSSSLTTCSVAVVSGAPVLTFSGAGSCVVRVTAAASANYAAATTSVTFNSTLVSQTITWDPTTALNANQSPVTTTAASALGGATFTYAVSGFTSSTCSIGSSNHVLTFTGSGTCDVVVTATDPNGVYATATKTVRFTISLLPQTITWNPTTSLTMATTTYTPSLATVLGGATVTYSVSDPGTTGCSVNSSTGVLSYTGVGNCTVLVSSAATGIYASATKTVVFAIALVSQTVTWTPTYTTATTSQSPYTPDASATASGGTAITYSVSSAGTTGCQVDASTGMITYTGYGQCVVLASAAATTVYAAASTSITFSFTQIPQYVIWNPSQSLYLASLGNFTPSLATTTGDGAITYSVFSYTTSSCSVDTNTGQVTVSGGGQCTILATAAATSVYSAASSSVTFSLADAPTVSTFGPYAITTSGGTISGSVSSNSSDTSVWICYSTSADLANCTSASGSVISRTPTPGSVLGADGNETTVSYVLTGLTSKTVYYYQVMATNGIGTTYGSVLSFQTVGAPTVVTLSPSSVGSTSAVVEGTVNANSASTTVTVCYSTSSDLSNCTSALGTVTSRSASPGTLTGSTTTTVALSLSGLTPGVTIYYQVKAVNSSGTVYGSVLSFTTSQVSQSITAPSDGSSTWANSVSVATTSTSGLTLSYSVTGTGCSVTSAGLVSATQTTVCVVTIAQSGNTSYLAASSVNVTITFTARSQATLQVTSTSVTLPSSLTLTTSGGSGTGAITYTLVSTGTAHCSLTSGVITATGEGTCTVSATRAADTNYLATTSSTTTITVNATTPGVPTGVSATSNANTQSVVSWTAPSSTGGSAITAYVVSYSGDGGQTWQNATISVTSSPFTVTGLTNGTTYQFRVAATNAVGTGSFSSPAATGTPATTQTTRVIAYVRGWSYSSSTLTRGMQKFIRNTAAQLVANHCSTVALTGFANYVAKPHLSHDRAVHVAAYLATVLHNMGKRSIVITITPGGSTSGFGGATLNRTVRIIGR